MSIQLYLPYLMHQLRIELGSVRWRVILTLDYWCIFFGMKTEPYRCVLCLIPSCSFEECLNIGSLLSMLVWTAESFGMYIPTFLFRLCYANVTMEYHVSLFHLQFASHSPKWSAHGSFSLPKFKCTFYLIFFSACAHCFHNASGTEQWVIRYTYSLIK